jgi:CRISPR system Cascade subunit CasC
MNRTILDIHILQTVPPSNLNRDDTGSPKTAVYGGVRRARVSSQAWKRATRVAFREMLDPASLGVRTRRVVELLAAEVARQAPELAEPAAQIAASVLSVGGIKLSAPRGGGTDESGYLIFLSRRQIEQLAHAGVEAARAGARGATGIERSLDKKAVRSAMQDRNSVDVALFGRMVADVTELNVDAAAQVAHAISVHEVETEYDYFTAVDDHKQESADEDAGAGMIGTVEFNSATLYRFATLDVDRLRDNLGDAPATVKAVEAFLRAFVTSMPTGKQNTFANRTLPDAVLVRLRDDQPISFVGAFEEPVRSAATRGRVAGAAEALARYAKDVEDAYGATAQASWVVGVGDRVAPVEALGEAVTLDQLIAQASATVATRIDGQP